jgi:hypothetical protein
LRRVIMDFVAADAVPFESSVLGAGIAERRGVAHLCSATGTR